jgi:Domain of unknown function (DUF4436)
MRSEWHQDLIGVQALGRRRGDPEGPYSAISSSASGGTDWPNNTLLLGTGVQGVDVRRLLWLGLQDQTGYVAGSLPAEARRRCGAYDLWPGTHFRRISNQEALLPSEGSTRRFTRFSIIGLVIFFVGAYAIVLYNRIDCGCARHLTEGQPAADGTTVTIDLQDLQSVKGMLNANVTLSPGPGLLDPATGLKEDVSIAVHSAATPTKRTWTKGMVPGVFPVPLTIGGDLEDWPFDTYHSGPVTVDLFRGASQVPERTSVTFVDRVPGWKVDVPLVDQAGLPAPYRVELHRSPSTKAFGAVIVGVLIALAGVALFVAIQTMRNRRKFQPPMTTWYAAMLFAVMPLRNGLPDAPPIGSWIDVTVTLWVIAVLAVSMLLFISCWRPDPNER